MTPSVIHHVGKRCAKNKTEELIKECAIGIHLTTGGEKLLGYYASCGDGFCPARKTVSARTGIHVSDIYRYKRELEELGLICDGDHGKSVYVNWDRIWLYSTLDPNMTNRFRKNITVSPSVRFGLPKKMGDLGQQYRLRAEGRKLTLAQEHFYKRLDEMSEEEWNSVQRDMGVDLPVPLEFGSEPYIDWVERDYDPSKELPVSPEEARWQQETNKQLPF